MNIQIYQFTTPHPIIEEIREIKADRHTDPLTHVIPPLGYPELIFYVGHLDQIKNATNCHHGLIKGQYNTVQKIDFIPNYHFISIVLKPYGLKQLFDIEARELLNAVIALEAHPTTQALLNSVDNQPIDVQLVQQLARTLLQFPHYPITGVTRSFIQAVKTTQNDPIHKLAKTRGIGLRTLQRNFKKEVGLNPSEFVRIIRMNRIERRLAESNNVFEIIADFDFTDQSHFVKEFKQWRNHTPQTFLKQKLLLSDQLSAPEYTYL